jgi:hypothetical protein
MLPDLNRSYQPEGTAMRLADRQCFTRTDSVFAV